MEADILPIDTGRNALNDTLNQLDSKLMKLESEVYNHNEVQIAEKTEEEVKQKAGERFSSIPNMMKCYLCEDYCDNAVQIVCCYENFCDKHIKEEIMKNFTCPNCKAAATLRDIIPNKKLRESIIWFRGLLAEVIATGPSGLTNLQQQNQIVNTLPVPAQILPPTQPTMMNKISMHNILAANYANFHPNMNPMMNPMLNPMMQMGKKMDIDKIERGDAEMTPEEKMQMYNNKLTESERKPSEGEKDENKSVSDHNKSGKEGTGNNNLIPPHSEGTAKMPHMPMNPMMHPNMMYMAGSKINLLII